jgi:hypothetical protein
MDLGNRTTVILCILTVDPLLVWLDGEDAGNGVWC